MRTEPRQSILHHTVVFKALGSMSDDEVAQALAMVGVHLPVAALPEGCKAGLSGAWLACGLRSDGVVELWRATAGGVLPRLLKAAAIPYCLRDCAGSGH